MYIYTHLYTRKHMCLHAWHMYLQGLTLRRAVHLKLASAARHQIGTRPASSAFQLNIGHRRNLILCRRCDSSSFTVFPPSFPALLPFPFCKHGAAVFSQSTRASLCARRLLPRPFLNPHLCNLIHRTPPPSSSPWSRPCCFARVVCLLKGCRKEFITAHGVNKQGHLLSKICDRFSDRLSPARRETEGGNRAKRQ